MKNLTYNVIHEGVEAQETIETAVNFVYDNVTPTMGADGKLVMYRNEYGYPKITKDGVTVAKALTHENPVIDEVVQTIKQASLATVNKSGDGTTATVALVKGLYTNIKDLKKAKLDILKIKEGIQKISKDVEISDIYNIAKISANGDEELATTISDAYKLVGLQGHVTMGKSNISGTSIEHKNGIVFSGELSSRYFATDSKGNFDIENARVLLVTADILSDSSLFNNVMRDCLSTAVPLVLVYDGVNRDKIMTSLSSVVIGSTADKSLTGRLAFISTDTSGNARDTLYHDLANALNTKVITDANFKTELPKFGIKDCGAVNKVSIRNHEIIITPEETNARYIQSLQDEIKSEQNVARKLEIERRLAMVKSSVAVIECGRDTMSESEEVRDRLEDAIGAVNNAIKYGMVAGGGNALAYVAGSISDESGVASGVKFPMFCIYRNYSINVDVEYNKGINLYTGEFTEDLISKGVVDPTKVVLTALDSAMSIVTNLLQIDRVIHTEINSSVK